MKDLAKITSLEMPTFRNQMRVKCEFSFAEWASHLGPWGDTEAHRYVGPL